MSEKEFVIVGGSRGMGFAMVKRLAAAGHGVTVLSRTAGELSSLEGVKHVAFDVLADEVTADLLPGEIHGLAYCPGTINLNQFKRLKPETFRADFELNVIGAVKTLQAAMDGLKAGMSENSASSVVLFSTVAVAQGMFAHASVAASKGAIEALARTLAAEWSPEIRVNCVAPALTDTSLTERFFSSPDKVAALAGKYPLGRTGTADDMASLGCFLLGPDSGWITGQVIGVDGGMGTLKK